MCWRARSRIVRRSISKVFMGVSACSGRADGPRGGGRACGAPCASLPTIGVPHVVKAPFPLDAAYAHVYVTDVRPALDGGRFPVKRVVGEALQVEATLVASGHDLVSGRVLFRHGSDPPGALVPVALSPAGNDRFVASFPLHRLGRLDFTVEAWVDGYGTFARHLAKRVTGEGPEDPSLALADGARLVGA